MLRLSLFIAVLALLAAGCASRPSAGSPATAVTGKVTVHRSGVAGVRVEAYPATVGSFAAEAPRRSAASDARGRFRLELPPGDYYLFARGGGWFAFYGRNPVTVPAAGLADLNLGLVAAAGAPEPTEPFIETGVAGQVLVEGRPLPGAMVHLYTDLTDGLKGMGYAMAGPTGPDGGFEVAVPPGTYYLLARQRQGGAGFGPLRAGDFVGYYPDNPVKVAPGAVAQIAVPMLAVPERVEDLQGSLFGENSIRGRILDAGGRPVAGARAVLYDDPQMFNRPLYVSPPTGADGVYLLSFPHGGTYYLAARNTLGGAPGPGDLYGTWDGSADHSLVVPDGAALTGIDIVVEEMW